jgi:hypothetical protein
LTGAGPVWDGKVGCLPEVKARGRSNGVHELCMKSNNYINLSTVEGGREGPVEWLTALNHQIITVASHPQNDF